MEEIGKFGAWDYVVFGLMLGISSSIGIYHAWKARRNLTNREFLIADRELNPFPVAMSLLASFQSAVTVLGIPAQMYTVGTQHWAVVIAALIAVLITDRVFLELFFRVNVTSVNEYLDRRFHSKFLRMAASLSFVLSTVFYLGTVLYGPSLALNSVTPLTVEASVITIGLVCTFYTTIGGMKAVVHTDCLQMFIMIAGLLMIIVKGVLLVGGLDKVWKINEAGGRIQFLNMVESPYSSVPTLWEVVLSFSVIWGADYGISQTQVQRYYSTSSLKNARRALYINLPLMFCTLSLGCLSGVVIYAYYHDCDPLRRGIIKRQDQLVPYFVMDTLSYIPGLAGLFVSCVFSGSLSTLSSGFNALSAVAWEDFLSRTPIPKQGKAEVIITKTTAAAFGVITIGFAFLSARIPSILQAAIGLSGAIMGPLFGTFLMGALCPFVNKWGAIAGLLAGEGTCVWIIIGSLTFGKKSHFLPTSTHCSSNSTIHSLANSTTSLYLAVSSSEVLVEVPSGIFKLYHISSYLIPVICFVVTVVIGLLASVITGGIKNPDYSPELLSPALQCCSPCCLPEALRNYNENMSASDMKFVAVPTESSVNRKSSGGKVASADYVTNGNAENVQHVTPL